MRFTQRRRNTARRHEVAELNITAFMNLMVVLVPFLLITAVFTRTAIVELNIPATDNRIAEQPPIRPQISLYRDRIAWSDGQSLPQSHARQDDQRELQQLRQWLQGFQSRHPDNTQALLLVAPDVDYAALIAVMDHIRSYPNSGTPNQPQPLFPEISLGDAP